jgi:hypothetical protein
MGVTLAEHQAVTYAPRVRHLLELGWRLTDGPEGTWTFTHPLQAGYITIPADSDLAPGGRDQRSRLSGVSN